MSSARSASAPAKATAESYRAPPFVSAEAAPLRVLIAAEHASARFGGEAALPLHYFRVLRDRGVPVWLVTHARTRAELGERYPEDSRIIFVDDTFWHRTLWRLGKRLPASIAHLTTGFLSRVSTQLTQRRRIQRLVREHAIDVVHQPIPVSPREPSLFYGFGVPVVIGPMNGGMDYPPAFRHHRSRLERALVGGGRTSAALLNRIFPGKRRAAALLVANARTRLALPAGTCSRVVEIVENGVDLGLWRSNSPSSPPSVAPLGGTVFVFMGRLVGWKAVDLLLRAFARARVDADMSLCILGDGEERQRLELLADELHLPRVGAGTTAGSVQFSGWLSQRECSERLATADVLVLPSLLECGGAVVLEAMALGKPVVATAWGGPMEYLDESCGVLVPPVSAEALVAGFAEAMISLARSPALRAEMGAQALARASSHFDWELKVDRVVEVYRDVVAENALRMVRVAQPQH